MSIYFFLARQVQLPASFTYKCCIPHQMLLKYFILFVCDSLNIAKQNKWNIKVFVPGINFKGVVKVYGGQQPNG